ncbi:MAG: hypothetical protein KTR25_06915 [Myxococcales bacterium]|nr:hypothetical protein [Myxococcales bacterium]
MVLLQLKDYPGKRGLIGQRDTSRLCEGRIFLLFLALSASVLSSCTYRVVRRALEPNSPSDDIEAISEVRLYDPLTWRSLPLTEDQELYDLMGPLTLEAIVSSETTKTDAGLTCSQCHYNNSGRTYAPPIEQEEVKLISPTELIGGISWAGEGGWAERLVARTDMDEVLQSHHYIPVFRRWLRDSALVEPEVYWSEPIQEHVSPILSSVVFEDVINSRISARSDGLLCAECHYEGGPFRYRPEGVQVTSTDGVIGPHTIVDGRTWSGPYGWAERFLSTTFIKPQPVVDILPLWLNTNEGRGLANEQ